MELPLFTTILLALAATTDIKWRKIPDIIPVMIGAAAFITYLHMSPVYLAASLTTGTIFAATAILLERRKVWARGDTYLFTATGIAAWPITTTFLTVFIAVAALWTISTSLLQLYNIKETGNGQPFAPVFFLTWTIAIYLI